MVEKEIIMKQIQQVFRILFLILLSIITACSAQTNVAFSHGEQVISNDKKLEQLLSDKRILLFSKTTKFRHKSIEDAIKAFQQLGQRYHFSTYSTEDAKHFTAKNLKQYDAIVFISTTGSLFNKTQRDAFKQYIQNGGGFMGIHGSSGGEGRWPWFVKLQGATFKSHGKIQAATVTKVLSPALKINRLPNNFQFTDEWYNFNRLSDKRIDVLLVDEKTFKGGKHGEYHPIAWYQEFDGGRSFYTALGHKSEAYYHPIMQTHLLDGLAFVVKK